MVKIHLVVVKFDKVSFNLIINFYNYIILFQTVTYFRDSLLITAIILLETLIIRAIIHYEIEPFNWIKQVKAKVQAHQFSAILVEDKSEENVRIIFTNSLF